MDWNEYFAKMTQYDEISRQMNAVSQLNKFAEINERIERLTNSGINQILLMNERLDRLANPFGVNHVLEMNKRMERLMNPLGKLTAFMEQQDRMLNWTKSMAVLSPALTTTLDYFSKFDKLYNPTGFDRMLEQMRIGQSLNSISTLFERTAAIEKNFALFDRFSEWNKQAFNETNEVIAQSITLEDYQASMMAMLKEGFEHMRNELLKDGKPRNKELVKLFDRWLTIISIVVACVGIYISIKSLQTNGKETQSQEQLIRGQADTFQVLKQIIQQSTQKIWVVNRKCKVRFKPIKNSLIVDSIPTLSSVDVIATRQKWAYVSYYNNDTTISAGWVDKKFIDTIRNLKRPRNNSIFNR